MKILGQTFVILFLAVVLVSPVLASAQIYRLEPLVVCGYKDMPAQDQQCKFPHLILFVKNLIKDLVLIAFPLTAVTFAWAGFLILTSGGDKGKLEKGRGMLIKVGIGFAWIVGAYILVTFIINTFVKSGSIVNLL